MGKLLMPTVRAKLGRDGGSWWCLRMSAVSAVVCRGVSQCVQAGGGCGQGRRGEASQGQAGAQENALAVAAAATNKEQAHVSFLPSLISDAHDRRSAPLISTLTLPRRTGLFEAFLCQSQPGWACQALCMRMPAHRWPVRLAAMA